MYANSFDFEGAEADVESILWAIQNGRWKKKIQLCRSMLSINKSFYDQRKIYLPAITFSGIFIRRQIDALKEFSGLICVDIDGINPVEIKELLASDTNIYCMFASPSNMGLKILIKTDNNPDNHKEAVIHLQNYFAVMYDIEVDKSCKDVSRLCYVSYDPDLRFNRDSEVFKIDVEKYKVKEVEMKIIQRPNKIDSKYLSSTIDLCYRMAEANFPFMAGNRNNHIFFLSSLLNERGIAQSDAVEFVQNNYISIPEDCLIAINHVYKKNSHKFNTIYFAPNEPKIANLG